MPRLSVPVLLLVISSLGIARAEDTGPIAYYPCDEGQGSVLRDAAGHGHNGAISGAQFVKFGRGWALRFDGVDDFVDCGAAPALLPEKTVSLEAWVCPEAIPGAGEPGIVGHGYGSFVLTYYTDGHCWWYISGGGNNCRAPLTVNAWHHVVGTFDGQTLRLYLDGALADSHTSSAPTIGHDGAFFFGKSSGDAQFTRGTHFKGLIDEVRLYDRALSADEVQEHYRTTHLTNALAFTCLPYPFMGEVLLRVDTRGLGKPPEGASAVVSLAPPGARKSLSEVRLANLPPWSTVAGRLSAQKVLPGDYEVSAEVRDSRGARVGDRVAVKLTWPAKPSWPGQSREMRVMNNLVTELLSLAPNATARECAFTNPREGWVFFAAQAAGGGRVRVLLGPDALIEHTGGSGTSEAMRRLPAGRCTLRLEQEGGSRLTRLVVRAIPELVHAKCGANPHVSQFGPYDWQFLKRHILPSLNTMVGTGGDDQRPYVEEWKRQGKRWIVECRVPGLAEGAKVTADEAEAFWAGNPGLKDPLLDGVIADEFWSGDRPQYVAWAEAVRRIAANPALKGKTFYPYCGSMVGAPLSRAFMQAVLDGGYRFALETYLPEQRTEERAAGYLDGALTQQAAQWEAGLPGSVRRMIVCFGYFSAPPESLDVDPAVNYKVFLDLQFHRVANDPAFFGVAGLMTYLSSYADEETVRWAGKLFRHYAIEGRSDRLTLDPYLLPHLRNGDFEHGLDGWRASAAEEGSIATRSMSGYSWLEGRYPKTSQGDTFLWLKRSAGRPNTVSQTVRALQPGRLYSLRAFSSAIADLATKQQLAVSITLSGGELLPERCFQHLFPNCYSHHLPPFDDQHQAWMNYHFQVFRAKSAEAQLTISDWPSPDAPGGPVGQELAVNFVQVQPYDAP